MNVSFNNLTFSFTFFFHSLLFINSITTNLRSKYRSCIYKRLIIISFSTLAQSLFDRSKMQKRKKKEKFTYSFLHLSHRNKNKQGKRQRTKRKEKQKFPAAVSDDRFFWSKEYTYLYLYVLIDDLCIYFWTDYNRFYQTDHFPIWLQPIFFFTTFTKFVYWRIIVKLQLKQFGICTKKKKLYRKTKTTTETITEGKKRLERLLNFLCLFKPRNYGYWVMAKVMFCITFDDTLVPVTAGIIYLEDIIL